MPPRQAASSDLHQECHKQILKSVFLLCALLRAFDDNLLRHEHGALRGSTCLRGGDPRRKFITKRYKRANLSGTIPRRQRHRRRSRSRPRDSRRAARSCDDRPARASETRSRLRCRVAFCDNTADNSCPMRCACFISERSAWIKRRRSTPGRGRCARPPQHPRRSP
jgi:hypothetical protein